MARVLLELALFLTPFGFFWLYRTLAEGVSVRDRWPLTTLAIVGTALAVGALLIPPLFARSQEGQCYQAQRYVDGVLVPGRMVPCDEVEAREAPAPPPTAPPVAPRDERR